jgi:Transposase DNA-binding/Transposase DDE domain
MDINEWSDEEFGRAELGDRRRTERLKAIAGQALRRPAGQITSVFCEDTSREGAFRLMSNDAVEAKEISRAANEACARREAGVRHVFVPIDGTSLNLTDTKREKGLGVVGSRRIGARGLQVITAIAVSAAGVPLGVCGQRYWARVRRSKRGKTKRDPRRTQDKETQHWLTVMGNVREVYRQHGSGTKPWFQIDRGGDAWPILLTASDPGQTLTVRATYDRRLDVAGNEDLRHLWETVESQPALGNYALEIPARPERPRSKQLRRSARQARTATMEVKACQVTLRFTNERDQSTFVSSGIWAVLVREVQCLVDEDPIEWMLLTTFPSPTFAAARTVIFGYSQRWRIEEFHKAWKTGACDVEDTQLRDISHIIRWATVLASVALRILRMTYLARAQPDLPATVELTLPEIDAIFLASKLLVPALPKLADTVFLLAKLGGYPGKIARAPPGALVIARGLQRIQLLAVVIETNPFANVKRSDS